MEKIRKGPTSLPPRVLLSGPEGIGKTTWAGQAPNPLFLASEQGLTGFEHVDRLTPESLQEVYSLIEQLILDPRKYKTLVIDTADWLERIIYQAVCHRDGKKNIEDFGYGKGYVVAESELVQILQRLDVLRIKQKMGIIILSHVAIKPFNDPGGASWHRYELKGNKSMTGILREWPDVCLFAVNEVHASKKDGRDRAVAGERIVHTQWSPAWDAKNRLNLPPTLPLDYPAFAEAVEANSPANLRKKVSELYGNAKIAHADKEKWDKALANLDDLTPDKLQSAIEKLQSLQ